LTPAADDTPASPDSEGLRAFQEVLGKPAPHKAMVGVRALTIDHLFASVWTRPQLPLRDRSLITIALLAAQGRADQLRDHVRGALLRGLTREEILEVMVQVAHYAGWPAGMSGQTIAESVFEEQSDGLAG